jgi:hypothetical protein
MWDGASPRPLARIGPGFVPSTIKVCGTGDIIRFGGADDLDWEVKHSAAAPAACR